MSLCQKVSLVFVPLYSKAAMLRYVTVNKREKRKKSDCTAQEMNSTVKRAKQESVKTGTASPATDSTKSADADSSKFIYEEKQGDLFSCDPQASLAHCVSADMAMGKGIAVLFKKKFGGVDELKKQGKKVGEVAILKRDGRFIYYLVTKQRYFHKPTYNTLQASLLAMKEHCQQNNVNVVAMPKIGCGLDRLQWDRVSQMLKETFGDLNMTLAVYCL